MSAHADPLASTSTPFDFDEVFRDMGEADDAALADQARADVKDTLNLLLPYIVDVRLRGASDIIVGRRFLAVALVLEPSLFNGLPNLRRQAEKLGLTERPLAPDVKARLSRLIRGLFGLVATSGQVEHCDAIRVVGRKFISLAWVLNPGFFDGSPSLAAIARSLKVAPKTLQNRSSEASRTLGIVNRGQAHGWNRGKTAPASHSACPQTAA